MAAARVAMLETVPPAEEIALAAAYRQVEALQKPGTDYVVKWMDDDGQILRRFARTTALEAWLVATPVDADGHRDKSRQLIVCPVALAAEVSAGDRQAVEAKLVAALEALTRTHP